jgi:hypothetical protein
VSGLTVLFVILAVLLTVPVYAFAVRQLLGLRLSPVRGWIGGLIALGCASPIITAIGSSIAKHNGSWSFLPAVWFVILGVAIALLIEMLVLVIFEALVPSGTMPDPPVRDPRRAQVGAAGPPLLANRSDSGASRDASVPSRKLAAPSFRPTTVAPRWPGRCGSGLRTAA